MNTADTWTPQVLAPLGLADEASFLIKGHALQQETMPAPTTATTREHWYRHSELLRPIIKPLLALVRRNAKKGQ